MASTRGSRAGAGLCHVSCPQTLCYLLDPCSAEKIRLHCKPLTERLPLSGAVLIGVAMGCLGFAIEWAVVELNNLKFAGAPIASVPRIQHSTLQWLHGCSSALHMRS